MNNLLLINTPQIDYLEPESGRQVPEAVKVKNNILKHLLYDTEFMKNVAITGIILDFFPIVNEANDKLEAGQKMPCLSFTKGAGIIPEIADNLHYMQECSLKKLPKNDGVQYERSVFSNPDSGKFLLELLGPKSSFQIDDIYICGFSHDDSIISTLRQMTEFMVPDKIHVISDLIYSENNNEKNEIDLLCLNFRIPQNNFTRLGK